MSRWDSLKSAASSFGNSLRDVALMPVDDAAVRGARVVEDVFGRAISSSSDVYTWGLIATFGAFGCGGSGGGPPVGPDNRAPVVSSAPVGPSSAVEGDVLSYTCPATDPDGDALMYSWSRPTEGGGSSRVAQMRFDSPGDVSFTCTASDGEDSTVSPVKTVTVNDPVSLTSLRLSVENYSDGSAADGARFSLVVGGETISLPAPQNGVVEAQVPDGVGRRLVVVDGGVTDHVLLYDGSSTQVAHHLKSDFSIDAGPLDARTRTYDDPDIPVLMSEGWGVVAAMPLEHVVLYTGQGSCSGEMCSDVSEFPGGEIVTQDEVDAYLAFRDSTEAAFNRARVERSGLDVTWTVADSTQIGQYVVDWNEEIVGILPESGISFINKKANNQESSNHHTVSGQERVNWSYMGLFLSGDDAIQGMVNEHRGFGQRANGLSYCGNRSGGACPDGQPFAYSEVEKDMLEFISAYVSHARGQNVSYGLVPGGSAVAGQQKASSLAASSGIDLFFVNPVSSVDKRSVGR